MSNKTRTKEDPLHLSGHLHVTGSSEFIGDEIKPAQMLVAKLFVSSKAHAKIIKLDASIAEQILGVHAVVTHKDIPGENQIGHPITDNPLLAVDEVVHIGQPVAIIVAENEKIAEKARNYIDVEYKELPVKFTIKEAIAVNDYFASERKIECGDIAAGFKQAVHIIEGEIASGTQEHFYFETQRTWAIPKPDKQMVIYPASQSPTDVQTVVAHVLGVNNKDITVDVKRLGGGFGGKENSSATGIAALAALAARVTNLPVELKLTRLEDMAWTGKRHPFLSKYKIGFDSDGKILAYEVSLYANGGAFADLSMAILERGMLHADNAYYLPNAKILGYVCRTNLPANTAFRGFGAPQSVFAIEYAIEKIARKLKLEPIIVKERNLYQEGQLTPYQQPVYEVIHEELFDKLRKNSNYNKLVTETNKFNAENRYKKRGIGVVPIKFGISFTASFLNQGSALIWIYSDGSISLSHGGIEMGQELNNKVASVVASELGITLDRIRVESTNTKRIGNASPTAASSGSDINGQAALNAAKQLKERLTMAAKQYLKVHFNNEIELKNIVFENNEIFDKTDPKTKVTFKELAWFAYFHQYALAAHGFYKVPGLHFDRDAGVGNPFHYYVYGVCLSQVQVDILTGSHKLLKTYIVHEAAKCLNKGIDLGQITGAFIHGYGWSTMEENYVDKDGNYLAITPSTYKIPAIRDLPEKFEVDIIELKREHASVFGSKAIGEPPFIYGESVYFAIKDAVESIKDHNIDIDLGMPATPEAIVMAVEKIKQEK